LKQDLGISCRENASGCTLKLFEGLDQKRILATDVIRWRERRFS
jgi:hypothetical protein